MTRAVPDLNALRIFLEVAVTKSMTEAARRIGMSQSAVSQAIGKLEAEFGTQLLQRGRPVVLTPAGAVLERRAGALLRDALQLPHAVREAAVGPVQEIRLGMVDTVASTAGPELIQALTGTTTRVVLWSGLAPALGHALLTREVDAIVTSDALDDVDGLVRLPLWKEPFVLLLPSARDVPAGLATLADNLPMVRYSARSHTGLQVERHLRRIGLVPERRIEIDGSDALVAMVAAGVGWAITTPLCLLQGAANLAGTRAVSLPAPGFNRVLSLLYRQDGPKQLATRMAVVARRVLRTSCLARLQTLLPHLANTVEVAADEPVPSSREA